MALLINKNVTVLGDIELTQLYVRLVISYGPSGTPLQIQTIPYSSKAAYTANQILNTFNVDRVSLVRSFDYDREVDGIDALGFAHNTIKTLLTTDEMGEAPVLDPSTGEPTYDPSTGLPIMEEVVENPKFAQDSSILFVDVSVA